jgi:chemotaxis protein CheZ
MSNTQVRLGNALLKSLIELHESKGEVRLEDVGAIFENMASSLHPENTPDSFLRQEIIKLSDYISQAKKEIFSMKPAIEKQENEDSELLITSAGAELDAVVQATEEATNNILDAADKILEVSSNMSDKQAAEEIQSAANNIYDACNFQDITGQRINKVVKVLDYVDAKIHRLVNLFSDSNHEYEKLKDVEDEVIFGDKRPDSELMSGPQMPDSAPSQEDIDKLFDSMK